MDLQREQELMKERQEDQEFGDFSSPVEPEKDYVCVYCDKEPTRIHKATGEILPCKKCRNKRWQLKKCFLTLREFSRMMKSQGGCCAIYGNEFDYKNKSTSPNVDYCRVECHVRGLLCGSCNLALGSFKDDSNILASAIKYLTSNKLVRTWWKTKQFANAR